jgi:hypothetical protein
LVQEKVSVVELVVGRPVMVCCRWLPRWREKEKQKNREKVAETGKRLIFWLILDPLLSSLGP